MQKRGLSQVVTSLILILLVLVALGVVWVVVSNLITEGTEEADLGKFTIDLAIRDVKINPGNIEVRVKRNPGKGELSGIKFVLSDGVSTQVIERTTTLKELEEYNFVGLPYTGTLKEVSIVPMIKSQSGKVFLGIEADKRKF